MNARIVMAILTCAASLPALAATWYTPTNGEFMPGAGESSGPPQVAQSTRTVEQVRAELATWQRNPVTADGYIQVRGEIGWVYAGTVRSDRTRGQVLKELADFKRDGVTADGWTLMPGELGWTRVAPGLPAQATATSRGSPTAVTLGQRPAQR